ncbi:hypothetical protein ACH5RR_022339 [Cinchona calisaya]|uniref:Rx N-terminal domain-containing protein n=1 Tax=Cinchona calisaya TaxID=153742 RepID=A0ABD2ZAQ2_9GENT
MAELVICPLLQVIIDKLASPILEKFHDIYNLSENIKKLQQSLPTAHALLEDAINRQGTEKAVKDWLLKLKDIAYESEDILDEIAAEGQLCQLRSSSRVKVPGLFWPFGPSKNLFEMAENLQNKLKELDDTVKQGFSLNLREMAAESLAENSRRIETGSSILESRIYGRELDKERILKLLLPSCIGNLAQIRHLTITHNSDQTFLTNFFNPKRLRTFIFLCSGGSSERIPHFLPSFVYLRVLDLSGCGIKKVDESVRDLICLRYLDLSTTPITELPQTICNLWNLQTLSLSACKNLVELPFTLANVIFLRHLNIKSCERLACMPPGIGKLVHLQTLPIYIVGKGFGESIAELNALNLRGELTIKHMENVKDAKEAKMANLREKKHLQWLRLEWECCNENQTLKPEKGIDTLQEGENDVEGILECLEPYENLKRFHISGYPGRKFPSWALPYLVEVVLINCWRCKKLPSLGWLPQLQSLFLQGMDAISHIAEEFYTTDVPVPFAVLKELTFRDFPCLEEWSGPEKTAFPCLKKLTLDKCPNLKTTPGFPSLEVLMLRDCHPKIVSAMENITSLNHLVIDKFPTLPHISGELLENNKSLMSLEIRSCQSIRLLPSGIENATALKSLIVSSCEKLSYLPTGLHKLKLLDFFEITGCHRLAFLPEDGIGRSGSLKTFSVENCNNLKILNGFHHLTSLEQLSIMSCPKLTSLPDSFRKFSSLRSLNIVSCPELVALPLSLQHVTTLQSLVIHSCPGLVDLSDWFVKFSSLRSLAISNCRYMKSLPEGLKELRMLQHLSIQDCPHLKRLLCNKKGTEWQKIAHIPHIYIS